MPIEKIHGHAPHRVTEAVPVAPEAAELPGTVTGKDQTNPDANTEAVKISLRSDSQHGHAYGVAKKLQRVDTDGDKVLTKEELAAGEGPGRGGKIIARIIENYDRLDANHSGGLSFTEVHPSLVARAMELSASTPAEGTAATGAETGTGTDNVIPSVDGTVGGIPATDTSAASLLAELITPIDGTATEQKTDSPVVI